MIELLTVIAIIGILAAILIPVTGAVRESARRSQCTSNQRQIVSALHLYATDNKGFFPVAATFDAGGEDTYVRWVRDPKFVPYLPMVQRGGSGNGKWENPVFICPSAMNSAGKSGGDLRVTYAASAALYGMGTGGQGTGISTPRSMSTIVSPSRTVMLYDGKLILADTHTNYTYAWALVSRDLTTSLDATSRLNFLHKSAMNVTMVDGSVRSMTQSDVAQLNDAKWRGIE